jgi:hypothetical protein
MGKRRPQLAAWQDQLAQKLESDLGRELDDDDLLSLEWQKGPPPKLSVHYPLLGELERWGGSPEYTNDRPNVS